MVTVPTHVRVVVVELASNVASVGHTVDSHSLDRDLADDRADLYGNCGLGARRHRNPKQGECGQELGSLHGATSPGGTAMVI